MGSKGARERGARTTIAIVATVGALKNSLHASLALLSLKRHQTLRPL